MQSPGPAKNEAERLAFLRALKILDSYPEERFDNLTTLASSIFNVPVALISLVDENRQWFKSKCGLETAETPRDISFCGHVVETSEMLVIEDARNDERFKDNPLVLNDENPIIFYAGAPLLLKDKFIIGTLCIIAHEPKQLSDAEREQLERLARVAVDEIELRSLFSEANRLRKQLVQKQTHMVTRNKKLVDMIHRFKDSRSRVVNAEALAILGVLAGNLVDDFDAAAQGTQSLEMVLKATRDVKSWSSKHEVADLQLGQLVEEVIEVAKTRYGERLTVIAVEGDPEVAVRGVQSQLCIGLLCILCSLVEARFKPIRLKIRIEIVEGVVQCVFMSNGTDDEENRPTTPSTATRAWRLAQGIFSDHKAELTGVRIPKKGMRATVKF